MANRSEFSATTGTHVSDELLNACAALFSSNYGIWGKSGFSPGKRVKMSAARLREQSLSVPDQTVLATCKIDDKLVGHAFATVWSYDGGKVAWITQLVVDQSVRRRYIATQLLQAFKLHELFRDITAIGLASSHPASVNVLAKYSHVRLENIDIQFIALNAAKILKDTPINYLKPENVPLRGSLFENDCASGAISSAFTQFYVDHAEPLEALHEFMASGRWCLGELLEGHEFLVIVPVVVDY
ncbi:hypothetical protein D9619_013734 [Psilocybe cf. subviscida]|uniref:N-acetyltransferase domain-containing protein n=1 Tax=Psilocybe cf. subviscida TaxID=2480587 RepID=A0A8H5F4B8_9AGAR|nr:hypothetical protein D9619_013734 [Psilocybe cf. subviscida]